MKILLSLIILLIPLSISAELICLVPAGCKIEIDSGFCENCVESQTPNTSQNSMVYPILPAPEQNLLTSSIHHWRKSTKIGFKPNGERYTAPCRSGCPESRAATMNYMFNGKYWKKKGSHTGL
jgi:hypothetical protein